MTAPFEEAKELFMVQVVIAHADGKNLGEQCPGNNFELFGKASTDSKRLERASTSNASTDSKRLDVDAETLVNIWYVSFSYIRHHMHAENRVDRPRCYDI